ncbi:UNVERIFIED_CONTAM: Vacuolar protein sorting-associated protein 13 [Sesamum calycinum]|uniref:Vacuolar protein sorting-associated protein 13 n=1 Tax=Sesamum calycinum TaxID=2727403 RepID=A0AAW2K7Q1_9LAMI
MKSNILWPPGYQRDVYCNAPEWWKKSNEDVSHPNVLEKHERKLLISVHSEGAIKVLSIIDSSYHVLNDLKSLHVPQLKDKGRQTQKYDSFVNYKERLSVDIPFLGISLMNSHPEELLFACAKNAKVNFVQSLDRQLFSFQIASLQIDNQLHTTPYPVILFFNCVNKGSVANQMKSKDNSAKLLSGTSQIASSNLHEPVFSLAVAKWRNEDTSLVSFESISLRIADFYLEIEQEIVLRLFEFCKTASSRLQNRVFQNIDFSQNLFFPVEFTGEITRNEIQLSARKQKKIYVELFDMEPIKLTLSFSSSPWILRNGVITSGESLIHRGLMALADVEGAKIHFKQLVLSHQIASWESIQEILVSHYTRQFLHEMYKVFGSAGVIGNPVGFARSLGLGIKDFFSLPIWSVFQSPAGLITGMAQGTTSLLSNTVYAISDATSQFSKAAHKGIVAFTFDDQTASMIERQQKGMASQSKGVINEFLEGLTGVLQSPIKGAEKHGLPGVLSGIALGVTGLVARPTASILEVTGKTAQSIRNRSRIYQMGYRCFRVRLPRPLSAESPLKPYSWEEAVGTHVLTETDMKLRDETLIMCKALKQCGEHVLITSRIILVVSCSSLIDLGKPNFEGVPADPKWVLQSEIRMDSVILADNDGEIVHIVGSGSDTSFRQNLQQQKRGNGGKGKLWNKCQNPLPLFQTNLEFRCPEEADEFLRVLMCMIERGKEQGWGSRGSNVSLVNDFINLNVSRVTEKSTAEYIWVGGSGSEARPGLSMVRLPIRQSF